LPAQINAVFFRLYEAAGFCLTIFFYLSPPWIWSNRKLRHSLRQPRESYNQNVKPVG